MTVHVSVLADELVAWLDPKPGQIVVDGTLGGGGHTRRLATRVGPRGLVVALDRDPAAIDAAETALSGLPIMLVNANFCDLPEVLASENLGPVDGIVLDLGISSDQLADTQRGFSFDADGLLDLRMDPTEGDPAWRLLENLSEKSLADLIYEYGEERFSRRIARKIVAQRRRTPIRNAADLATLVRRCLPKTSKIDSATRTFQALRIAVNQELKSLEIALRRLPECMRPGAVLAAVSFHSLEDRRVKQAFRDDARYEVLTRRPIRPSDAEITANPRARSAKLRAARRQPEG